MPHTDRRMNRAARICMAITCAAVTASGQSQQRPRARDLGVTPGIFEPGPLNAITDVADVRVGHVTLHEGDRVRTGVTAIVPHGGNVFQDKVPGAVYVGNAFGKLAGSTQVAELGTIETPIVLTNTLAVGEGIAGVVGHTLVQPGNEQVRSVNALVGETNDGSLNDIRGRHVKESHVRRAIDTARGGAVEEGSVGAGTGTRAFAWKGGIGTSSRRLPARRGGYTVGVLVQANFGGVLTIDGVPVGRELADAAPKARPAGAERGLGGPRERPREGVRRDEVPRLKEDGSCMIVVATDAPLDARDLERLAARAVFGLARTGASYSNGSGDYAIAFSTAVEARRRFGETEVRSIAVLPTDAVSPLFQAALEATEEAVYNALLRATTVKSAIGTAEAIPIERVREILRKYLGLQLAR